MNSQAADRQVSIFTVLLSSSVVLGTITGVFYLVGGAYVEGYSLALGLTYLATLQPAEYILFGAEILLVSPYFLVSVIAVAAVDILMSMKRRRIPRAWESLVFMSLIAISSGFLFVFSFRTMNASRDLITSGACPVTGQASEMRVFWLFCGAVVVASLGFFFFEPRLLRLTFLVWGIVASVFCLYSFGRAFGAARLYERFQIVELGSTSPQAPSEARLLVLGADDKKMWLF